MLAALLHVQPAAAADPVVRTVPWVASNPLIPHDTWSGKEVTLKGTADIDGADIEYTWDFGDGSPVATGTVSNRYAIEARHTYTGTPGTVFVARLTVQNTATGETGSKEYFVQIREQTLEIEVNVAIDEGLWYLHKTQRRTLESGVEYGDWNQRTSCGSLCASSTWWAITAANVNALAANGHVPHGDASNPYVETTARAMRRIFTYLRTENIGPRTYPAPTGTVDPDSNFNGIGVRINQSNYVYQGGMFMDAIIAAGRPDDVAETGPSGIVGRTYGDIVQDMVDSYAFGQYNANSTGRGGWRYVWNQFPDNSAAQWAAIGMIPAERNWALTVPPWVKSENLIWLQRSQASSGVFGYTSTNPSSWGPYAVTPSGMVQLAMDGVGRGDDRWDRAETWLRDRFALDTNRANTAMRDYYYGMFSFVKAMRLHDSDADGVAEPIVMLRSSSPGVDDIDWYADPNIGVARTLIDDQEAGGFWYSFSFREHNYSSTQYPFETAYAILMLSRTLFEAGGPVAIAQALPNPGIVGQTINLDGGTSFHQDADRSIVQWEWDLDNDGSYETTGAQTSIVFAALGDYPVGLRVTDDSTPALTAETIVTVRIATPPLAPTANAGGPYSFCPGQNWFLDGSGSINPDDGLSEPGQPGDAIASYNWDLNGDGNFDDANGAQPDVTGYFAGLGVGNYLVQLEVTDRTASSYPSSGFDDLRDTNAAQVVVRDASDALCACVTDLAARPKLNKVQLNWTDTGAHLYAVYRATSQGGPYQFVATTDSRLSLYLDQGLAQNTTYYYVVRELAPNGAEVCQSNEARGVLSSRRSRQSPPVITSQPVLNAAQDANYVYDVDATDRNGDTLTYSLAIAPSGMQIDAGTGVISWQPSNAQVGDQNVAANVTDGQAVTTQSFVINVVDTNDPPQILSTPVLLATEQVEYRYDVDALDIDVGDVLTYSLPIAPAGMTIDPVSGQILWTPVDPGSEPVTVQVQDVAGASAAQSFTIVVEEQNQPPSITSIPPVEATATQPYSYDVEALDPNAGDVLRFDLDTAPVGMTIDATSGVINWTPAESQLGAAAVSVRVSDEGGLSSVQSFNIDVQDINRAPVITSAPLLVAEQRSAYAYPVIATDANGDTLSYGLLDSPQGMGVDVGGVVRWTPTPQQAGSFPVTVVVSDPDGLSDTQTFTVDVADVNDAPTILTTPLTGAEYNRNYAYDVDAFDPDGSAGLVYSLNLAPAGMSIEPQGGLISWVPNSSQTGPQSVEVVVSDPGGASDTQSYTINVTAPASNAAPSAAAVAAAFVVTGSTVQLDGSGSNDPDGDVLAFAWNLAGAPAGSAAALSSVSAPMPSFVADVDGLYQIEVSVSDGLLTSAVVTLTVQAAAQLAVTPDVTGLTVAEAQTTLENAGFVVVLQNVFNDNVGAGGLAGQLPQPGGDVAAGGTITLLVSQGPAPVEPPSIAINSPANNTTVEYQANIAITVQDVDLASYRLEVAPARLVSAANPQLPDADYQLLAAGSTPVNNTIVASFDATMRENDSYILRLSASDELGLSSVVTTLLTVEGEAKFGAFSLEYVDLSIPLNGIPIEVGRRYNTFTAARSGDFGFGWNLTSRSADVGTNTPNENGSIFFFGDTPFRDDFTRVYVTNPDGVRVGFTFDLVQTGGSLLGPIFSPRFIPDPGVYDKLEATSGNGALSIGANGDARLFLFGFSWRPSGYVLTTRENLRYTMDDTGRISTISDENGNQVAYTNAGIEHSSGVSVQYQRDGAGRITALIDPAGNQVSYTYDAAGDLSAVTDQEGLTTQFSYLSSPAHYLDQVIDPLGRMAVRTEYDAQGRAIATVDALGNRAELVFDTAAFLGTRTDERGNQTVLAYNEAGALLEERHPDGTVTAFEYADPANPNLPTTTTYADGSTRVSAYDARGNVVTDTDRNGHTTTYTYDNANRTTSVTDPLGRTESMIYGPTGNPVSLTNALGETQTATYDAVGRILTSTDAAGNVTTYEYSPGAPGPTRIVNADGSQRTYSYDGLGNSVLHINERGEQLRTEYDKTGRLLVIEDDDGNRITRAYNGQNLASITDAAGNITAFSYDAADRLVLVEQPNGGEIGYSYNATGDLIAITDPLGNVTQFAYDEMGRMVTETDPLGAVTSYTYDAVGNIASVTNRLGEITRYTYDGEGNPLTETWLASDGVTQLRQMTFTYDALNNLTSADGPSSSYTFGYDALDRLSTSSRNDLPGGAFTLSYSYDTRDNLTGVSDNQGVSAQSVWDSNQALAQLVWSGGGIDAASLEYQNDSFGQPQSVARHADATLSDLVSTSITEQIATGETSRITHRDALGAELADYRYSYEAFGRLASEQRDGTSIAYSYDVQNQLTAADFGGSQADESYAYDLNGNRSGVGLVIGAANRLLADAEATYAYDAAGRLIRRLETASGEETHYSYDHRGRMTNAYTEDAADLVLSSTDFVYDAFNRVIERRVDADGAGPLAPVSEHRVYEGQNLWADLDAAGQVTTQYLFGPRIDEALARYRPSEGTAFYLTDRLGTVRDLLAANGLIVNSREYSTFGELLSETNPADGDRLAFTGREFEASLETLNFRARIYDPRVGRFLAEDPLAYSGQDANLYRYAANAPINLLDPTGTTVFSEYAIKQNLARAQAAIIRCLGQGVIVKSGEIGIYLLITAVTQTPNGPSNAYAGKTVRTFEARFREHAGKNIIGTVKIRLRQGLTPQQVRTAEQLVINAFGGKANLVNKINASSKLFCKK